MERVVYEPNVQSSSNDSKSNGHADSSISSSLLILLHDVLMCDQVIIFNQMEKSFKKLLDSDFRYI